MALEGICPNCGYHYVGWSLRLPQHKTCDKCGAELKTISGILQVVNHNSLYTIKKRVIDLLNTSIIPNHGKKNDGNHEQEIK